ncbi:MAG: YqjD family protein [Pigmentiphaga sp.]
MNTENEVSTDTGDGQLASLVKNTEELLRRTASYGGAEIEAGRDRLKRQWESAGERAGDWRDAADHGVRRLARVTDECAHRHPWESIAVAAVAGAVFAACWLKRSR